MCPRARRAAIAKPSSFEYSNRAHHHLGEQVDDVRDTVREDGRADDHRRDREEPLARAAAADVAEPDRRHGHHRPVKRGDVRVARVRARARDAGVADPRRAAAARVAVVPGRARGGIDTMRFLTSRPM